MSERIREEIDLFVADLKKQDDKATWKQVSDRCKEKFPKAEVSLTANAIRKRYNALRRGSDPSQSSENDRESGMISIQDRKQLLKELMEGLEDPIENYVQRIIERVSAEVAVKIFDEKFTKLQNDQTIGHSDEGFPPAPPLPETVKGSRRHAVTRKKLAGTVDPALLELFEKERRVRGCSVSRMLDIVIWNYLSFGKSEKPKLSFELSEPSDNKA